MNFNNFAEPRNPNPEPRIVGVCGLSIVWANLAEVVSLAVDPAYRGRGLGKRLAQACLDEAARLGVRQVMTLTYERAFFEKLGFSVVERQNPACRLHNQHRGGKAVVAEFRRETLQIAAETGADIGVDRGGADAVVLPLAA